MISWRRPLCCYISSKKNGELNVIIPPKRRSALVIVFYPYVFDKVYSTLFLILISIALYTLKFLPCTLGFHYSCVHIEKSNKAFKFYKKKFLSLFFRYFVFLLCIFPPFSAFHVYLNSFCRAKSIHKRKKC